MIHVFYTTLNTIESDKDAIIYSECLNNNTVATKRNQFYFEKMVGRKLIQQSFRLLGRNVDIRQLKYSNYGKPYFEYDLFFSISYSENVIILAISDQEVGIDIERILNVDIHYFTKCFSMNELDLLNNSLYPLNVFYEFWTKKESVLKARGTGISKNMNGLDTSGEVIQYKNSIYYIKKIDLFSDYICHVSSINRIMNISMRNVNLEELI